MVFECLHAMFEGKGPVLMGNVSVTCCRFLGGYVSLHAWMRVLHPKKLSEREPSKESTYTLMYARMPACMHMYACMYVCTTYV